MSIDNGGSLRRNMCGPWRQYCTGCTGEFRGFVVIGNGFRLQQRQGMPAKAAREPRRDDGDERNGSGTSVITRTKAVTKKPNMYRVLLLNDDYTTQEFVILVLQKYFSKALDEAVRIMLHVHQHGVGECGIYTFEVAETKVTQVMDFARKHQHPLQCIMEKK